MHDASTYGRRWHAPAKEFEHDLARANSIASSGWAHYRFDWTAVHERPAEVRALLTSLLMVAA
ncbi:hypothetical protein BH24ACT5_BH24ACT5_29070 [soil metagenome]